MNKQTQTPPDLIEAAIEIRIDDLTGTAIIRLLQEHLDNMHLHSPPESVHALDLEALRKPDITFWSIWQHEELKLKFTLMMTNLKKCTMWADQHLIMGEPIWRWKMTEISQTLTSPIFRGLTAT